LRVVIFYQDIRTYGFKEQLYTQARESGVLFIRYDAQRPPKVSGPQNAAPQNAAPENAAPEKVATDRAVDNEDALRIDAVDLILNRALTLRPDLLVLSMPVVPRDDTGQLAGLFRVPIDSDGFFQEAHVKLRPVDFSTDGVFMAGMAHYPKLLDETMIQARAAAARAARVLSQTTITAGGRVATVENSLCTGCLTCVRICPFGVPVMKPNLTGVGEISGAAYIEAAICQGCGICAAECPAQAIQLMHYTDSQMRAKVQVLIDESPAFVPLDTIMENIGPPKI
jgi:heterodisulfide reductase subunit A-like polyferredoxin